MPPIFGRRVVQCLYGLGSALWNVRIGRERRILIVVFAVRPVAYRQAALAITCWPAQDGPSGLRILDSDERVDLLITDVGLSGGLNGRQVTDAARVRRPSLKVLFITGYDDTVAVANGRLDSGMEIMTKPFEIDALAHKVRALYGAEAMG